MNKQNKLILFTLLTFMVLSATSCLKDDDSEKRKKETRLIENYVQVNNITVTPTTSGLYFIPQVQGTGATPKDSSFALIQYKVTDLENNFYDGTDKALAEQNKVYPFFALGGPFKIYVRPGYFLQGVIEGLKMMKEGGKAKMIMPSLLAYNDYVPRIVEVELLKVITSPMAYEKQQIANYLDTATNISVADSLSSGVYYIQKVAGTGTSKPSTGQKVRIKYTGKLIDGRIFDKTEKDTTFRFTVGGTGTTKVIDGLDQGIRDMTVGGKSTIVIPYYRGYGMNYIASGSQVVIPYFSTLVYDVELVEITN